jgi:hypothetical protein
VAARQAKTAARIMHEAILAHQLVSTTDLGTGERVWKLMARRDPGGFRIDHFEGNKIYEEAEKSSKIIAEYRNTYPAFGKAYQAIFGDPLNIPSYGHFRKLVKLASNPVLTDPKNWHRLPDFFGALYQLSFCGLHVQAGIDEGKITKSMTPKQATRFRRECDLKMQDKKEQTQQQPKVRHA